ncbi:hypothetical protein BAE36_25070 [Rhizobium leguminosarum bv. trifolii]|uniref:Uncharacterized protein n=1 Tax=Rhizobium leguminosarum bv. trifolii TaxID=386 RepID=A0A1B8R6R8_RHILT|nr:hypothetical protein [Rhizobium leguminosarum]AOO92659.1 hypothetical protein [Rhizobium leguminosarum bv. trifolii]OBY04484.1 hypothetical protein BAE36_25070 [Rhizobium leguminosarum bv. trifolii]
MFLEKHSRYFRKFDFTFTPRHIHAPDLPLVNDKRKAFSIADALQVHIKVEKALEVQANGDIVEIMEVEHRPQDGALALLLHRASPNAADPTYRKKARKDARKRFTVRQAVKEADEEQSVSANVVIALTKNAKGIYQAALEEIPGISMAVVRRLISNALRDYPYNFQKGKKQIETYASFKPVGVKSESMDNALKKGQVNFVTLSRPAKPKFVDADGLFQPEHEVLKLRVIGKIDGKNWKTVFSNLVGKARKDGWVEFKVDIDLSDNRNRTVKIDRDEEAKEILFVRSELADFKPSLPACSVDIVAEVVQKAVAIAKM